MLELHNVRMEPSNTRKIKEPPNMTKEQSHMMLELHNMRMEPSNVRTIIKKTTKCDKRTVTCDVRTAQCEDVTIKCEKK